VIWQLPTELKNRKTWLIWRLVQKPGEPKPRKVPYYTNGQKRHGKQGGPEDCAALATFDAAVAAAKQQGAAGVGLAMLADNKLVGLDFDHCIPELSGIIDERVRPLIAGTYAEVSPSGTGIRAFYRGELPAGRENKDPTELDLQVFCANGYLTVTSNKLTDAPLTVAPLTDAVRDYWTRRRGSTATSAKSAEPAAPFVPESHACTLADVKEMLDYAEADRDVYESWRVVLCAIDRVGLGARDGSTPKDWDALAIDWSRHSPKFVSAEDVLNKKREGRKQAGPGIHYLEKIAREGGMVFTDEQEQRLGKRSKVEDFPKATAEQEAVLQNDLPTRAKRKPFKFETLLDDLLTRILPSRDWALYPYFPNGTVSGLAGVGGLGKSNLMLLIAVCKALGLSEFCGLECTPGRVVILTAEDDLAEMQRRLQRILHYLRSRNVEIDFDLLQANLQFVDLTGGGAENMMVKAQSLGAIPTDLVEHVAREVGKADMIMIDTLSRFSGASENDNTAGAVFISACETIAKRTGAAVLVLSHTGKAVAREGLVDQYVSRGASSYSDNARSVLVLASPSAEAMKTLQIDPVAVNQGDVFRLAHVKSNYAKRAPDVYFKRLDDGVVAPFNPTPKLAPSEDELSARLLGYIGAGEVSRNYVKDHFQDIFGEGTARNQALEVFQSAVRDGRLIWKRNFRNADYYKAADTSLAALADMPMRAAINNHDDLAGNIHEPPH